MGLTEDEIIALDISDVIAGINAADSKEDVEIDDYFDTIEEDIIYLQPSTYGPDEDPAVLGYCNCQELNGSRRRRLRRLKRKTKRLAKKGCFITPALKKRLQEQATRMKQVGMNPEALEVLLGLPVKNKKPSFRCQKIMNRVEKLVIKTGNLTKGKSRRELLKNYRRYRLKNRVKRLANVAKKAANIVTMPIRSVAMAIPRGAFLMLIRINLKGMASKLAVIQQQKPVMWRKIEKAWIAFGGSTKRLKIAVRNGKKVKPKLIKQKKMNVGTEAALTTAGIIISTIVPIMAKALKGEKLTPGDFAKAGAKALTPLSVKLSNSDLMKNVMDKSTQIIDTVHHFKEEAEEATSSIPASGISKTAKIFRDAVNHAKDLTVPVYKKFAAEAEKQNPGKAFEVDVSPDQPIDVSESADSDNSIVLLSLAGLGLFAASRN